MVIEHHTSFLTFSSCALHYIMELHDHIEFLIVILMLLTNLTNSYAFLTKVKRTMLKKYLKSQLEGCILIKIWLDM